MNGTEDDIIEFIEGFKNEFKGLSGRSFISKISQRSFKIQNSVTVYRKSTPLGVKGSLIYNEMLKKNKLTKKYPKIQEGEKIKYTYLVEPNPTGDSFGNSTKEFNLDDYIDYDKQFQKSFLDPMKGILDTIGWECEKKDNHGFLFLTNIIYMI